MKYPDKGKVHIYLCDDGHREEMKALAMRLGVNYLDREDHAGAKAGNLNNALAHSNSPYVVTFDADMIPRSNFLMRTIPYFVDCDLRNRDKKKRIRLSLAFFSRRRVSIIWIYSSLICIPSREYRMSRIISIRISRWHAPGRTA